MERPTAERIEGVPAAIAVSHKRSSRSSRSTVGTSTEIYDYLRLLFAKIGQVTCYQCGGAVRCDTPQSAAEELKELPERTRYMLAFAAPLLPGVAPAQLAAELREDGFVRAIAGGRTIALDQASENGLDLSSENQLFAVVDRLAAGGVADQRLRDSLETAFAKGRGRCFAFVEETAAADEAKAPADDLADWRRQEIDGRPWRRMSWSRRLVCERCGIEYPEPEPRLFSFNNPLGACPECEGFGSIHEIDMDLVVPDASKSLGEGAIAPWRTPAYAHELEELSALAGDYDIPLDAPFAELDERARRLIDEGVPERNFGGLRGFFRWLERRKYKMHIRVFLSRWRSYRECPACHGQRLRPRRWPCASASGTSPRSRPCRFAIRWRFSTICGSMTGGAGWAA